MRRRPHCVPSFVPLVTVLALLAGCKTASETGDEAKVAAEGSKPDEAQPDVEPACTFEAAEWVDRQLLTACQWIPAGFEDDSLPLAPWKPEPSSPEGLAVIIREEDDDDPLFYVRSEGPKPWFLAADRQIPASKVAAVLDGLAKLGATEGVFVVRTEAGPQRDEPRDAALFARLRAELDTAPPRYLADALGQHVATCDGASERLEALLSLAPSVPCETQSKLARELLVACDCPSWSDAFVTTLRVLAGSETAIATVEVSLSLDAPVRPDEGTTWGDFVAGLGPGKITVRADPDAVTAHAPGDDPSEVLSLLQAARKEREKATVVQDDPRVTGGLSADIVQRFIAAHLNSIRHCYQRALETDSERLLLPGGPVERDHPVVLVADFHEAEHRLVERERREREHAGLLGLGPLARRKVGAFEGRQKREEGINVSRGRLRAASRRGSSSRYPSRFRLLPDGSGPHEPAGRQVSAATCAWECEPAPPAPPIACPRAACESTRCKLLRGWVMARIGAPRIHWVRSPMKLQRATRCSGVPATSTSRPGRHRF